MKKFGRPDGSLEHPEVRYEGSDANFRWIFTILLGAVAVGLVIMGVVWFFFYQFRDYQAQIKQSPFPLATGPSTAVPLPPRLEQIDRMAGVESPNVFERESAKLEVLDSYGATAEEGFIHIPIERAIQVLLENKTLKSRPEPPADQLRRSSGLLDAGEPNAGRLFNGGPQ